MLDGTTSGNKKSKKKNKSTTQFWGVAPERIELQQNSGREMKNEKIAGKSATTKIADRAVTKILDLSSPPMKATLTDGADRMFAQMRGHFKFNDDGSSGTSLAAPKGSVDLELGSTRAHCTNGINLKRTRTAKDMKTRSDFRKGGMSDAEWQRYNELKNEMQKILDKAMQNEHKMQNPALRGRTATTEECATAHIQPWINQLPPGRKPGDSRGGGRANATNDKQTKRKRGRMVETSKTKQKTKRK